MLRMYGLHSGYDAQKNSSWPRVANFAYCSHFCRFRANRPSSRAVVFWW